MQRCSSAFVLVIVSACLLVLTLPSSGCGGDTAGKHAAAGSGGSAGMLNAGGAGAAGSSAAGAAGGVTAGSAGSVGVAAIGGGAVGGAGGTAGVGAAADGGSGVGGSSGVDASVDAGSPSAGRNCKRGVAYNKEQAGDATAFGTTIGWWYNWDPSADSAVQTAFAAADVEYVPMAWSAPPKRALDAQHLIDTIPQGAKYLLGFNEPNYGDQAGLTPEQAAAAWPELEKVAKARGLKLVSPAVNYCGNNCNKADPFKWLDAFFAACKDCQVDYVAFHWYACSLDALKWAVGQYETKYGKPVWLTEFSCLDDPGDHSAAGQLAYMKDAVPFLESDPNMFRYAWFIGRSTPAGGAIDLFAATGTLTTLGSTYVSLPSNCD